MQNSELKNMMAGLAKLGGIYLRISDKINAFYEENSVLFLEEKMRLARDGYIKDWPVMPPIINSIIDKWEGEPIRGSDRRLLGRYGDMFYDPVLTAEVTEEFLSADEKGREKLRERIKDQLSLFPDPEVGCGDLTRFGYRGHDLFGVGLPIARDLFKSGLVTVYAVFSDGSVKPLSDKVSLLAHPGMFGVKKQEWVSTCLDAALDNQKDLLSVWEETKAYQVYQWDDLDMCSDCAFLPYSMIRGMKVHIDVSHYELVYEGKIAKSAELDDIFELLNLSRPEGFAGHSLSVSDVIVIEEDDRVNAYFVDSIGFRRLDDFFTVPERKSKEVEVQPQTKVKENPPEEDKSKETPETNKSRKKKQSR